MNEAKVAALLGRTLTPIETSNFKTYLKIARESLDELLCTNLCDNTQDRIFVARDGYSTVFTDIFTEIADDGFVKLNGDTVTDYTVMQWDRRNGNWYNSIVFDKRLCDDDEVEVSASWGFSQMPSDLQLILAQLFGLIGKKNKYDSTVTEKRVEDFMIKLNTDADLDDEFFKLYASTISKYSLCGIPYVKQGKTRC